MCDVYIYIYEAALKKKYIYLYTQCFVIVQNLNWEKNAIHHEGE